MTSEEQKLGELKTQIFELFSEYKKILKEDKTQKTREFYRLFKESGIGEDEEIPSGSEVDKAFDARDEAETKLESFDEMKDQVEEWFNE